MVFDHHDLAPELIPPRFGRDRDPVYCALLALERASFGIADIVVSKNETYRRVAIERGGKALKTCSSSEPERDLRDLGSPTPKDPRRTHSASAQRDAVAQRPPPRSGRCSSTGAEIVEFPPHGREGLREEARDEIGQLVHGRDEEVGAAAGIRPGG